MAGTDEPEASQADTDVSAETLRELRQYRAIVEVLPDPVFVTDQSGYLISANEAFVDRFGFGAADDDRAHLSDFLPEEDVDTIIGVLQDMVMADPTERPDRRVELTGIAKSGRQRTFSAAVVPFAPDGEFTGAAAVLRDITTRKRRDDIFTVMDRALRHNLRTNVNIITGFTDNLRSALGEEHQTSLTRIHDSAQWLYKLGDSLRTLQVTIEESFERGEPISVSSVVDQAVEKSRDIDEAAEISVHISSPGELEAGSPVIYALENVIENAIVHNDSAMPKVNVWVAHAPQDGWIDIHVEDNGPGIPAMERDIVLGETSVDQLQHASGLGLWITRWVVDLFDGQLQIEDNAPRGSVVTLRLPLAIDGTD